LDSKSFFSLSLFLIEDIEGEVLCLITSLLKFFEITNIIRYNRYAELKNVWLFFILRIIKPINFWKFTNFENQTLLIQ